MPDLFGVGEDDDCEDVCGQVAGDAVIHVRRLVFDGGMEEAHDAEFAFFDFEVCFHFSSSFIFIFFFLARGLRT